MTVTRSMTEQLLHCYNDIEYLYRKVPINVTDSFKLIKFLISIHSSIIFASFLVPHYSKKLFKCCVVNKAESLFFFTVLSEKNDVELKFSL